MGENGGRIFEQGNPLSVQSLMSYSGNLEDTAESSADNGGRACEVSEGRKILPGLFIYFVLRVCGVLSAEAEELEETRTKAFEILWEVFPPD